MSFVEQEPTYTKNSFAKISRLVQSMIYLKTRFVEHGNSSVQESRASKLSVAPFAGAHRLSTIRKARVTFVLANGRIREIGDT
jgi:ABC-type transport system involved in Fe-S cluster assembly fused permease/ATPase subunit